MRVLRVLAVIFALGMVVPGGAAADEDLFALSKDLLLGRAQDRDAAAELLIARGQTDIVPSMVLLMRIGGSHVVTQRILHALTGEEISTWRDAMHYQEAHPEITPHPSYYDLKFLSLIHI